MALNALVESPSILNFRLETAILLYHVFHSYFSTIYFCNHLSRLFFSINLHFGLYLDGTTLGGKHCPFLVHPSHREIHYLILSISIFVLQYCINIGFPINSTWRRRRDSGVPHDRHEDL